MKLSLTAGLLDDPGEMAECWVFKEKEKKMEMSYYLAKVTVTESESELDLNFKAIVRYSETSLCSMAIIMAQELP